MEKKVWVPPPSQDIADFEYKTFSPKCPLQTEDRLGGWTCLYHIEEIGACDPGRCPYYQEIVKGRR